MAANVQVMNDKDLELQVKEAEFALAEEKQLIKHHDGLYVPANFEEDHNYYADENGTKRYNGTTTVLGVIAKPNLYKWYADMAVDHIEANLKYFGKSADGGLETICEPQNIFDEARLIGFKKRDKAGELGTLVHAEIERLIKSAIELYNGKLNEIILADDTPAQVREFVQWAVFNDVKFLGSEVRLYSEKLWVAGTCDAICTIGDKLYVLDIKTGSQIYDEAFYQASAYAHMAREMGLYQDFHGVVIVNIPRHGGIKVQESYDLKGNFNIFKAAVTIFKGKEARKVKKLKK